jgi:mRNA interferase MazF
MAITSQIRPKAQFAEMTIEDWKMAGLLKASVIKPVIFTVEKKLVRKVLGCLTQEDKQQLGEMAFLIIGKSK